MRAYFVSEKHMELDIHGFTVDEAKQYLELSINVNHEKVEEIIVIHGYRSGNALKDFVQNKFESKYLTKKYLWLNPGITSLIIGREQWKIIGGIKYGLFDCNRC